MLLSGPSISHEKNASQRHVIKVDALCTSEVWFHGIDRESSERPDYVTISSDKYSQDNGRKRENNLFPLNAL